MAEDIANLGISVDSTDVVKADTALDKLAKTSAKTETATDKLNTSTKGATQALQMEGNAAVKTATATGVLSREAAKATTSQRALAGATRALTAAFAGFIGLRGAQALKNLADEATNVENRLRQVATSQENLNALFAANVDLAIKTRSSLTATTQLFQRLTIAGGELNLSQKEVLRLSETINKSFAVSGATATEAAGATRQLAQGLAAGALRGDEFNSVAEQAPLIMRAISDETGLAIGELREFAATGGITAEIVIDALKGIEQEIDDRFAKSIGTFDQKMGNINTKLVNWARNNDDLTTSLSGVADVAGFLAGVLLILINPVLMVVSGWTQLLRLANDLIQAVPVWGAALDAILGPFASATTATVELSDKVAGATGDIIELSDAFIESRDSIEDMTAALADDARSLAIHNLITKKGIDLMSEEGKALQRLVDGHFDAIDARDKARKSIKEQTREIDRERKAVDRLRASDSKLITELERKVSLIGESTLAKEISAAQSKLSAEAEDEMSAAVARHITLLFEEKAATKALADATKAAARKSTQAAKEAARAQQRAFEQAFDFTADLIDDAIKDWDNFGDAVVDIFRNMLRRMVAELAASKILQFMGIVGGSFTIAGSAAAGSGGAGALGKGLLSSAGSLLSGANLLGGGGLASFFGFGEAAAAGTVTGVGSPGLAAFVSSADGFVATLGNSPFISAITNFAPAVAGLAGALEGFNISGVKGALTGAAGGFFGAQAGIALAAAAGPIGIAIAAVLGGLLGGKLGARIFGGEFETKGAGVQLGVTGGGLDAFAFERQKKAGGLFGSTKRRTVLTELPAEQAAAFDAAFSTIEAQVLGAYAVLGKELGEDVFDSFNVAIRQIKTSGKSEEEISAAIEQFFTEISNQMTRFLGEDVSFERLLQLAEGLSVVNGVLETLGVATLEASKEGALLSLQLLNVAGGMENLLTSAESFHRLFVEDRDPMTILTDALTAAVESVNETLPGTRDEFRDLVQALELTTAQGKKAFVTLTGLSEAADQYYSELERLSEKQQADDIKAREDEITAAARAREDEMDAAATAREREARAREDFANSLMDLTDKALADLGRSVQRAKNEAKAQFDIDLAAIKANSAREIDATNARILQSSTAIGVLGSLTRAIGGAIDPSIGGINLASVRGAAQADIFAAAEVARSGGSLQGLNLERALDDIAEPSEQLFGSFTDYLRDFQLTNNALVDIRDETEKQLTAEEQSLRALNAILETQKASAQTLEDQLLNQFEAQIDALDLQLQIGQDMVDGIRGVDNSIMTLGAAIRELATAAGRESGGAVGVAPPIQDSINSQIEGIYRDVLKRGSDAAGLDFYSGLVQSGALSLMEVRDQIADSPEARNIPGFAHGGAHQGGLRFVGEFGPEIEATGPSRITSTSDLLEAFRNDELLELMRALLEINSNGFFTVARNTLKSAKIEERWDTDGLPPERVT